MLLGWGEGTVTQYLNGDIPTKQYSDTLKRILVDYNYMTEVLEQNKDKVTDLAYSRCKRAQGFYKAFTGEFLFNDECEAWLHGPVYRNIYNKYKNYGCNQIEENPIDFGDINLTNDEKEFLDSVIMNFGCYSGKVLAKITHIETPWRVTRKGLGDHEGSNRIIDKKLIDEYFNGIKSKYGMLNISDIRDYSTDLFKKTYH
ncbi:hypothetical protein SCACP_24690 [Sporomusa carbonis]